MTTTGFYNLRTMPEEMALNLHHLDVTPCLEIKTDSYFKVDVTGGTCNALIFISDSGELTYTCSNSSSVQCCRRCGCERVIDRTVGSAW
jgi:hypothetical protein